MIDCRRLLLYVVLAAGGLAGFAAPPSARQACCGGMATPTPAAAVAEPAALPPVVESEAVWQTDAGRDFRLSELRGHPVVIAMFYASCEGVCVITRDDMKAVEASLPAAVRARTVFVLVTLAPDLDTPKVLKEYRAEQGLAEGRWRLLRGSAAQTATLAAQLGVRFGRDASGLFRHSSELAVLDETGRLVLQQEGVQADLARTVSVLAGGGK